MRDREMHAYERHACTIHAHETHAYEVYPYEIHTREMHACETPAHEMQPVRYTPTVVWPFWGYGGADVVKGCHGTNVFTLAGDDDVDSLQRQ